jgi:subtilase family serine protease
MRKNALAVIFAALALMSLAASVATSRAMTAETVALTGNHPPAAATLASVGNADADQTLSMEIHFAVRNEAELNRLLAAQQDPASPNYRHWLATGEYDQRFGPRASEIEAVAGWLKSEGFTVEPASDGFLKFSGTVAQAERTFSTHILRFGDGSIYGNVDDPEVPARFAGVIGNVMGLDNMTHAIPVMPGATRIEPPAPSPSPSSWQGGPQSFGAHAPQAFVTGVGHGFGPRDLRTFYHETVNGEQNGYGGCIAIVGMSNFLDGAIASFRNQFMASEPAFNIARVLHGTDPGLTGDNSELEAEVDLEWAHAVAPAAAERFHYGNSLIDDISGAVDDSCDVVSISFTFCGPPSGYASAVERVMKKAAALGESVFVASGDDGAAGNPTTDCLPGTSRSVSEMAADPNVTAVGGTQFAPIYDGNFNDVGYSNNEQAWNASGGGVSKIYRKPAYQTGAGVPRDGHRDIPDVALIAGSPGVFWGHDSSGNAAIACCVVGTSVSAPIWAGFTRVLAQTVGFRLGPMNPLIYQLANQQFGSQSAANGFHDVTVGINSADGVTGFDAGPGYDQATGWGTIDFDVFAAAAKAQPTPTPGPLTCPKVISFASHKVGAPPAKPRMIRLTNPARNKIAAHMIADASLMHGTDFSIASSECTAGMLVDAGKSCDVAVLFNPRSAGKTPLTDVLTFSDNASNSQQQVSLKGIGK